MPLKYFNRNVYSVGGCDICHRERHDHRYLHFHELLQQVESLVQVRGIQHHQQPAGRMRICHPAQDNVYRDTFIGRIAAQAVDTWQVDQFDGGGFQLHGSGMFFNRNARVVPGGLAQAGQAVEEGAFPEFGLPMMARVVDTRRRIPISSTGTQIVLFSDIRSDRGNAEIAGLLFTDRNSRTENRNFHRIATDGGILKLYFCSFDKPKHHQADDTRLFGIHFSIRAFCPGCISRKVIFCTAN